MICLSLNLENVPSSDGQLEFNDNEVLFWSILLVYANVFKVDVFSFQPAFA